MSINTSLQNQPDSPQDAGTEQYLPSDVKGPLAARWAAKVAEIAEFKAVHGKLPGDNNVTPREHTLRVWMRRQLQKEADGKLSASQSAILDRMDSDWRANQVHLVWENNLAEARLAYGEDRNTPASTTAVGRWMAVQRKKMAAGKLREDQVEALNSALPGWREHYKVRWDEQARGLEKYVEETGTFPTSRTRDPEAYKLGLWLKEQRRLLRVGTLKADRAADLDQRVPGWRSTKQASGAV